MRPEATLVNVARGRSSRRRPYMNHLAKNPKFAYATDVWWPDGKAWNRSLPTCVPRAWNFIGTPHGFRAERHNQRETSGRASSESDTLFHGPAVEERRRPVGVCVRPVSSLSQSWGGDGAWTSTLPQFLHL